MSFRKRLISLSLLGLLICSAIFLFLSCSSDSSQRKDGVTEIRYMRWGTPDELEAEQKLLKIFEEANPDISVKLEVSAWGDYWRKLQATLSGHTAPDVFLMGGQYLFDFVEKGVLEDLNGRVEAENFDLTEYFSVPVNLFRYKDGLWGLPRDCNTVVIYYNKNLFKEAGVPFPADGWTWDDFMEAALKLSKDTNGDGRNDIWSYIVFHDSMETRWGSFIWQNEGHVLNADRTKCLIDQPEAIEAIQFQADLIHKFKVAPDIPTLAAFGSNMFMTGKLAMESAGSWGLRSYRKIEKFEWDIVLLSKGKIQAAPVNGLANVVYSESKQKEAAWRLVKFLSGKTCQEALARSGTSIPALKSVAYSDTFLKSHEKPEHIKVVLDQLDYGHTIDFTPLFARWDELIMREMELVFRGEKSVKDACRDAARQTNAILKKNKE
jgi:multiple sugar transport system substrate-binding protein